MKLRIKKTFVVLTFALVLAVGCDDPQKEIMKIFGHQGLNLIEPARSYIAIGGIFIVPKKGTSHYLDPYDSIKSSTSGMSTDFQAIVLSETIGKEVGISAAMSGLAKLIPLPIGFSFDTTKKVKLDQIDTGGSRYRSQDVDALILMPQTKQKLISLLNADKDSKVYVVQEVYSAKAMSVSTVDNTSLSASFGGGGSVAKCGNVSQPATGGQNANPNGAAAVKDGASKKPAATSGDSAKKDNKDNPQNAAVNAAAALAKADVNNNGGSSGAGATKPAANNDGGAAGKEGVAVSLCHAVDSSLSFTAANPLPFAVRLNQIQLSAGGTPEVVISGVSIPNQALPISEQKTSAFVQSADQPIVPDFDHLPH
jgi:hypothetical protein